MTPEEIIVGEYYRTRDDRKCRVYGVDLVGDFPVLVVFTTKDGKSNVVTLRANGMYCSYERGDEYNCQSDLMEVWKDDKP